MGIKKSHVLRALYDAFHHMELRYEESLARINLPDLNIELDTELSDHELRLRVARPIDKIFLNRLCRTYQNQYLANDYPLAKRRTAFSALLGILCLAVAIYLLVDWISFFSSCPL
jgi:hypothetical protein